HKEDVVYSGDKMGSDIKGILESGNEISVFDYISALERKEEIRKEYEQLFTRIDILATPTLPTTTKKIGVTEVNIDGSTEDIMDCMTRFVSTFNLTGHPALSIPCGITSELLPVGLQLVAGLYDEKSLINAGFAYEKNFLSEFYQKRDSICNTNS